MISVESADEFYCIMGVVTREMLEFGLMDANNLVKVRNEILFPSLNCLTLDNRHGGPLPE